MIVFYISFFLYLFTLFPGVAPYRDTGEMTSVAYTLGVAHPPGYPFYALLSKIFLIIMPWGNTGYKLNVLSALAGALTIYLVYRTFLHIKINKTPAFFACLLFATSYLQWYLSLVSEMYTLNTFFAAFLMCLFFKQYETESGEKDKGFGKLFLLFAFVFGIGLGNRMDLLLFAAGFSWIFFIRRNKLSITFIASMAVLFILGFSVFLYLPLRSTAGSFLDWNHPSDLSRFWGSLTRKTHGGTLDLLSTNYASGENFYATMKFYFNHLLEGFAYLGVLLGAIGLLRLWKKDKNIAFSLFIAWLLSGPIFIYLANMPPNTHALVILEAHFLLPNLVFTFWRAQGFLYFHDLSQGLPKKLLFYSFGTGLLLFNLSHQFKDLNKRENFSAYDYSKNIFRSLPTNSAVISKKDVQLFLLWDRQLVEHQRLDLAVLSQGLAGSFWYIESWRTLYPGLFIGPLTTPQDWQSFIENNKRDVYFTGDAEYPGVANYTTEPWGLANRIVEPVSRQGGTYNVTPRPGGAKTPLQNKADVLLNYIYPYRGSYIYTKYREFFTPDLIEEYAKGYLYLGQYYMNRKEFVKARKNLSTALMMKQLFPLALNYSAYTYFIEGNYELAVQEYQRAVEQYKSLINLTIEYNSLPDVKNSMAKELSEAYMSLGVCYEKINRDNDSLNAYQSSVNTYPLQAKAYFNKSVIYWKKEAWPEVIKELENALRIDPKYQEAAYYLQLAYKNMNSSKK